MKLVYNERIKAVGEPFERHGRVELHRRRCCANRCDVLLWRHSPSGRRHYFGRSGQALDRDRATSVRAASAGRAERMTDLEWFAFVILPLCVGALGGLAAWAGRRYIR